MFALSYQLIDDLLKSERIFAQSIDRAKLDKFSQSVETTLIHFYKQLQGHSDQDTQEFNYDIPRLGDLRQTLASIFFEAFTMIFVLLKNVANASNASIPFHSPRYYFLIRSLVMNEVFFLLVSAICIG